MIALARELDFTICENLIPPIDSVTTTRFVVGEIASSGNNARIADADVDAGMYPRSFDGGQRGFLASFIAFFE
jgi:hypothetical protein